MSMSMGSFALNIHDAFDQVRDSVELQLLLQRQRIMRIKLSTVGKPLLASAVLVSGVAVNAGAEVPKHDTWKFQEQAWTSPQQDWTAEPASFSGEPTRQPAPGPESNGALMEVVFQIAISNFEHRLEGSKRESGVVDKAVMALTGISVKDAKQNPLGGKNSVMHKPLGKLGRHW